MPKLKFIFLISLFLSSIISVNAGGWFYREGEINTPPDSVQIVVTMNGDDTITTTYRFNFSNLLDNFVWIIPLPSEPIAIEEPPFWAIWREPGYRVWNDGLYYPTFPIQNHPCDDLLSGNLQFAADGWGGDIWGEFNATNYHTFNLEELLNWMDIKNTLYSDSNLNVLQGYAERDMVFLAMDMQDLLDVDPHQLPDIGVTIPVSITYEASELEIPIMLISEMAESIPIYIWIFADSLYKSTNYDQVEINFEDLHRTPAISRYWYSDKDFFSHHHLRQVNNYLDIRSDDLRTYNNEAFIIEYGGVVEEYSIFSEFSHITRFYGETGDISNDPVFRSAPEMDSISNMVDIRDYQDPLHYYGCSNRPSYEASIANEDIDWSALPSGRERVHGFDVAIPENWVRTDTDDVIVFAERQITVDEINYLSEGYNKTLEIPVFAFSSNELWQGGGGRRISTSHSRERYIPFSTSTIVTVAIASNQGNWNTNEVMYRAMLDYVKLMPNYLADDLDFTLLLNGGVAIGYPDTWIEETNEYDEATIYPINGDDALIRVRDNSWYIPSDEDEGRENRAYQLSLIQDEYPDSDFSHLENMILVNPNTCFQPAPVFFETETSIGYVVVIALRQHIPKVIELTATYELWDDYQETLFYMAEHIGDVPCMQG